MRGNLQKEAAAITGLPQQSSHKTAPHIPGQLFQSVSLPVDARLSDKFRTKIWSQEYVDFGSLLTNQVLDNQYQITVQNAASDTAPSLCIEPVTKPKKITSIEAWISSFHVSVGVYTKKFPHEAPALMTYGEIIQDLAVRGHNWKFCDENFRFLRQAHGALLLGTGSMMNYGLSHKMFCVKPLHRNFLHRSAQSLIPSQRATVFVFIKAANALRVVLSSILVIGVKGRTW